MVGCDLLWLAVASCILMLASSSTTTQQGEYLLARGHRYSAIPRESAEGGSRKGHSVWFQEQGVGNKDVEIERARKAAISRRLKGQGNQ